MSIEVWFGELRERWMAFWACFEGFWIWLKKAEDVIEELCWKCHRCIQRETHVTVCVYVMYFDFLRYLLLSMPYQLPGWLSTTPAHIYIEDSWFVINGSLDAAGDYAHGTNSSASFYPLLWHPNLIMASGSAVRAIGTSHSVPDAHWACSLDGNGINSNPGPPHPYALFNHLEYVPSSTVAFENKMVLLRREASAWNNNVAQVMDARFALNFYGMWNSFYLVSCSWCASKESQCSCTAIYP